MDLLNYEEFGCPYCGGANTLEVDMSAGRKQRFVVDCEVCCAPVVVTLQLNDKEILSLEVKGENQ